MAELFTRIEDEQGNVKITIHDHLGYTASCDALSQLSANARFVSSHDQASMISILKDQQAHIAAQLVWITRPKPNPERLEELCRYLIAYETVSWRQLKEAFPDLYAEQVRLAWPPCKNVSEHHLRAFVIPKMKEALGLNPEESVV